MFYSKYCPSIAITFFHLSVSIRIPPRKNASSFEAVKNFPLECLQIDFDRRCNMRTSIIMQENNYVVSGVVVGALSLEYSTQSHQLCLVDSPSNCFVRFEQLRIHNAKLIPPNTQQEFFP